jgi:[NiFe] hydrogenase diaphorase moiety large subunit
MTGPLIPRIARSNAAPGTSTASGEPAWVVAQVLAEHQHSPHALVQMLRVLQARLGWLPPDALSALAAGVGHTLAHVKGVASFYRFFHQQPVGRYRVLFSDNVTDQMQGSAVLMARLCQRLGVAPGELSRDGRVSVATTSCTGLCDQGPALLINHHQVVTRLDAARVDHLADLILGDTPLSEWPPHWFQVEHPVHRADVLLTDDLPRGAALAASRQRGAAALREEMKRSGLRGRGGAGFSTGLKWQLCSQAPGEEHHVVCNADEGEPGTFKDRVLLARHADTVFEGMTVAARAIGARSGLMYLRGEYRFLLEALQAVLRKRREDGLLGTDIQGEAGFDFDISIHLGAGAYVCGEESALIESLEGKRGTPRIRPPFPVEQGYLGQPTAVNNVETFCAAAHIALRGGEWWAGMGTPQSTGTKIHSVSGDCERPGLYEYPYGTSISQILHDCGARDTQAVQVGGPSGTCLSAQEFDRIIGFEDVPTAGAFMVFDASRDMFEVARSFAHFFAHESCGFCTPCRVGTSLVARRLDKLARAHGGGRGSGQDLSVLRELDTLLHIASHCGLGASACNPLRDTLKHFQSAYGQRTTAARFEPDFDLDAELSVARRWTGRDDEAAHLKGNS